MNRRPAEGARNDAGLAATSTARLTAATVLLGCLIVILSQFVTGFTLVDNTDSVIATITLFGQHGAATTIFAVIAAVALLFAVLAPSRLAVIVVIGMGVAVLVVFILIDVPNIGSTGMFNTPGAGNLDATGHSSAGLWMELVGAVVILLGAAALSRLDEAQLRAIAPDRRTSPDRKRSRTSR